jgi:hypothetical protein
MVQDSVLSGRRFVVAAVAMAAHHHALPPCAPAFATHTHTGVLEAVRISCAGFPSKRLFIDFVDHFWSLAPDLYHRQDLDDRCFISVAWRACVPRHSAQPRCVYPSLCVCLVRVCLLATTASA